VRREMPGRRGQMTVDHLRVCRGGVMQVLSGQDSTHEQR
jgi:hypothetical protein